LPGSSHFSHDYPNVYAHVLTNIRQKKKLYFRTCNAKVTITMPSSAWKPVSDRIKTRFKVSRVKRYYETVLKKLERSGSKNVHWWNPGLFFYIVFFWGGGASP